MTRPCTAVKTWNFFRNEQELGTKGLLKDDLFRLIRFVRLPYHSSKRAVVGGALNFAHVLLGLSLLVGRVELLVVLGWKWRKTSNMCRKVGCRCFCSFVGRPKVQTVKLVHQQKKTPRRSVAGKLIDSWTPSSFNKNIVPFWGLPLEPFRNSPLGNRQWGFIYLTTAALLFLLLVSEQKKSKTKPVFEKRCP